MSTIFDKILDGVKNNNNDVPVSHTAGMLIQTIQVLAKNNPWLKKALQEGKDANNFLDTLVFTYFSTLLTNTGNDEERIKWADLLRNDEHFVVIAKMSSPKGDA